MPSAKPICFILERQTLRRACSRARAKTGKRIAARMAMMAITTRSSISVKPRRFHGADMERSSFRSRAPIDGWGCRDRESGASSPGKALGQRPQRPVSEPQSHGIVRSFGGRIRISCRPADFFSTDRAPGAILGRKRPVARRMGPCHCRYGKRRMAMKRTKNHPLRRPLAVVVIAALGLLAPTIGRAAAPSYTFKKLFAQGDPPGSVVGDIELM